VKGSPLFRVILSTLAIATLVGAGLTLGAAPASAAPRVSITVTDRPSLHGVADSTYLTEVTVSGTGFQSIENGFGGIYVLFGWADQGSWKPSKGGHTGTDYRYVYDDESNPVGYQLFVSFPGSSTSYANNGGYLKKNGTWSATMKIPGPVFQAYNRSGKVTDVNCTKTQCGIMTIGAHGVVNAKNESFTPIDFTKIYSASDGRASSKAIAAPNTAVAPSAIGGRPATIPTVVDFATKPDGAVTTSVGDTRVTLTVPGASSDKWLGVYFDGGSSTTEDPLFAGWFKPSSTGLVDVNIPENLGAGEHTAVVYSTGGSVTGWSAFTIAAPVEPAAPAASAVAAPVAATAGVSPLLIPTIIVGALALAAVALLVWAVLRRRRTAA